MKYSDNKKIPDYEPVRRNLVQDSDSRYEFNANGSLKPSRLGVIRNKKESSRVTKRVNFI